jgi:hypothetical protein
MRSTLFAAFTASFVAYASALTLEVRQDTCSAPPFDNCDFYTTCLEPAYQCGPDGYPIGYGDHFCRAFSDNRGDLSAEGQTWMINTMHCLQTSLIPDVGAAGTETCDQLRTHAFATHAGCYVDNGLCDLGFGDWFAIVGIVGIGTLVESLDAAKASGQAALGCFEEFIGIA